MRNIDLAIHARKSSLRVIALGAIVALLIGGLAPGAMR